MKNNFDRVTRSVENDGAIIYRNSRGHIHRDDGPAVEWKDGTKFWYYDGMNHRVGAPAIERADGAKEWWLYGRRHREDGPAYEGLDGRTTWFLNGVYWPEGPEVAAEQLRKQRKERDIDVCRNGLPHDIIIEKPFVLKPKGGP